MAKILLTAWGTRGDCQAAATVGGALARRDHDVCLAAPAFMEPEASRLGVEFRPMGDDPVAWFDEKPGRRHADPRRAMPGLLRLFARQVDRQFEGLSELVASTDLVVGQALSYAAPSLAEARGVPYLYLSPNVFFFDSVHHPSLGINRAGMPAWVNELTWKQFSITYNVMFRKRINRHPHELRLDPIGDARSHVFDASRTIAILDPELYPVPVDVELPHPPVGSIAVPAGDLTLDDDTGELLEGPQPTVLVDFGSMPDHDPRSTTRAVVEAARAGVAQVVVPHGYDQHASARCLRAAGVTAEPLPRRRLDATSLAERLVVALTDDDLRSRAREVGEAISSRDSLGRTVRAIEGALVA